MYIVKNAVRNIMRSKGRNILIGIITVVIATSACVALSIKESAAKAQELGKENISITAQISVDRQKLMENTQNSGGDMKEMFAQNYDLSLEEMEKYAESQYVNEFMYSISSAMNGNDSFEPVDTSDYSESTQTNETDNGRNNGMQPPDAGRGGMGKMGAQGDFSVTGYSSLKMMSDFVNGTSKISQGETFDPESADMNCIISNELALLNDISVGDKITLLNPNNEEETFEFTVVGIYTNTESTSNTQQMRFDTANDPANKIYTSYTALNSIIENSQSGATTTTDENGREQSTALRGIVSGTYSFTDAESFEAFKTDAKNMGLSDTYTINSSDLNDYEASLEPLKNLSKFSGIFLILVLIIGAIILFVFNIFNIRERKYEVGVLTAIGMKKGKVAVQFVTEIFLVTFISVIIGTMAGAVISVPVADKMLESQVQSLEEQSAQQEQNFGKPMMGQGGPSQVMDRIPQMGNQNVSYIENINASVDIMVVLKLMGIGVLLTIFASSVAVVFILRYEPLKILSNRT